MKTTRAKRYWGFIVLKGKEIHDKKENLMLKIESDFLKIDVLRQWRRPEVIIKVIDELSLKYHTTKTLILKVLRISINTYCYIRSIQNNPDKHAKIIQDIKDNEKRIIYYLHHIQEKRVSIIPTLVKLENLNQIN